MTFKVGDRVELIRNNTAGSPNAIENGVYGKAGDTGTVLSLALEEDCCKVMLDRGDSWFIYGYDMKHYFSEQKYDPTQMGDKEDDI